MALVRCSPVIITNLLVKGVSEALASSQAVRVYICNLMTQANESLNLTASQHIERIYEHAHRPIFDYALVNTAPVSRALLDRYAGEGASRLSRISRRLKRSGFAVSLVTLPLKAM